MRVMTIGVSLAAMLASLALAASYPAHAEKVQIDTTANTVKLDAAAAAVTCTACATATNQTAEQANAGSDATKAVAVQGVTGGKSLGVTTSNLPTTVDTNSGVKSASTVRVVIATDQPALTTPMPVTSSNLPTTVDTNSGVKSASTIRMVLATDQPTMSNAQPVTISAGAATIGALTANQSVNVAQINGVAPTMGNGVAGTGVQRVAIASDNTSNTNPFLTNVGQVNGVTLLAGNGVTGTGSMRVTIASDNTANSNPWLVSGGVAGGATDSGNPVKVGGKYNSTRPTYTDGQRTDAQSDTRGNIGVTLFSPDSNTALATGSTGDAQAAPSTMIKTVSFPLLWNTSTYDRPVTITGLATTGLGVQAMGPVCQYNTSLPNLSAATYGGCQISNNGSLRVLPTYSTNTGADGISNASVNFGVGQSGSSTVGVIVGADYLFNNTTWDRPRSVLNGDNTTGTGVQAVGIMPQLDDVAPQAVTENQYGDARMSAERALLVSRRAATTRTYGWSGSATLAGSATDFVVIPGNASTTVKVLKIRLSCTATSAGLLTISVVKRSSADTSGTSSNFGGAPFDSANTAASSTPKIYTVNPTLGGTLGSLTTDIVTCTSSAGTVQQQPIEINFGDTFGQAPTLRGTAQELELNANGGSLGGATFYVDVVTTEQTTTE